MVVEEKKVFYQLAEGWQVEAIGDFNGDGQPDIVLQSSSGLVAFWLMTGTEDQRGFRPLWLDADWRIGKHRRLQSR